MYFNERVSCVIQIKKKHADLDAEEYADNHISYLDIAISIKSIILTDLNNMLHGLTMTPLFRNDMENTNGFAVGEYIAAGWFEDTTYEWYLSVTEQINPNNTIVVSYLIRADSKGRTWVFPDEAQFVEIEAEQILMRNIHVTYMRLARIEQLNN